MNEETVENQPLENTEADYTEILNAILVSNDNIYSLNEAILNRLEILILLAIFCTCLLVYKVIRRKRNV